MTENISNKELIRFLDTEELQNILKEYREASKMADSAGFNVFKIISDYYYRENFHGDILYAFLKPDGEHGEGDKFLKIFIEMLGVKTSNYGFKTTVEREVCLTGEDRGRMDFVIKNNDESNPHCIIIENKLYDAVDMPNQLPRYFKEMSDQKQTIDKIVYLPLSIGKHPEDLPEKVGSILKIIPAINVSASEGSLINDWIAPCIEASSNLDCISILRQYKRLIITFKPEIAKYASTIKLYRYICNGIQKGFQIEDILKGLESQPEMSNMLASLKSSLAIKLTEELKKSYIYFRNTSYDNGRWLQLINGHSLWIFCGEKDLDYTMRVPNPDYSKPVFINWLSPDLKIELEEKIQYHQGGNQEPYIHFKITEEPELIKAVQTIVEEAYKQTNITKETWTRKFQTGTNIPSMGM